jgi:hypothetical protein
VNLLPAAVTAYLPARRLNPKDARLALFAADLAPVEREAIQHAIEFRGRWLRDRRTPSQ